MPLPPHAGATQSTAGPVLPMGLVIPNIPVTHPNGTKTPKLEAWRDVVRHWTVGEPRLNLFVPLKDWPHHYYNGRYGRQHNTKYYQRSVIALEFLNEYVRPFFRSPPSSHSLTRHSQIPRERGRLLQGVWQRDRSGTLESERRDLGRTETASWQGGALPPPRHELYYSRRFANGALVVVGSSDSRAVPSDQFCPPPPSLGHGAILPFTRTHHFTSESIRRTRARTIASAFYFFFYFDL